MKNFIRAFAIIGALFAAPLAVLAQFADQATYVATPGGTANALTLAVPNWNRNLPGVVIRFLPASLNTAATTVVVNGVGSPIAIKKPTGNGLTALVGGELIPTEFSQITYDGVQFQLGRIPLGAPGPQGYLTPCQTSSPSPVSGCAVGSPISTGDVISATTLYYEGLTGPLVPIFNGGQFVATPVTEAQMTLILSGTANTANNAYDVCIYLNGSGVPAIGTLPAWSNAGAGTGARSSAISNLQGVWLNSAIATVTNNNVGVSVAANRCTVVASILIDAVNGQVTMHRTSGQSRRWALNNFYNVQPIKLLVADPTASWTNTPTTWRVSHADATNIASVITGIPGQPISARFLQAIQNSAPSGFQRLAQIGVGVNVTNAPSGQIGTSSMAAAGAASTGITTPTASYDLVPAFGLNRFSPIEQAPVGSTDNTFFGQTQMQMIVSFNG